MLLSERKYFFPVRSRCSLRVRVSSVKLQMRFKGENLPLELHFRDVTVNLHRFATSGTVHTHTLATAPGSAKCFFDTASISKEKSLSHFWTGSQIKRNCVRPPSSPSSSSSWCRCVGSLVLSLSLQTPASDGSGITMALMSSRQVFFSIFFVVSLCLRVSPTLRRPCLFWVISHSSLCAFDRWFQAQ